MWGLVIYNARGRQPAAGLQSACVIVKGTCCVCHTA